MKHRKTAQRCTSTIIILFSIFFTGVVAASGHSTKHLRPGVDYIPIRDMKDLYGILLRTQKVELRGQILYGLRKINDPHAAIIASMFLDDKHKTKLTIGGVSEEKRVCDIACETLDAVYNHPFGKRPGESDLVSSDARIRKWKKWFR